MRLFLFLLSAVVFPLRLAHSQVIEKSLLPPSVTANGEAVITMEPDQAEIDIGVTTQAKTAPEAGKENADRLARVTAELKKLLVKGDDIKTTSYSLNPNYRYPREGGRPEITGFTAINIVRIRTGSLDKVGRLIDTAMQSGANTISRLAFTLKDEHSAQLQALRLASTKAKAKAEEMAGALGLRTLRILSISEGERGIRPIVMPQARGAQAEGLAVAPTPIESGTIEIRSSVTLVAEVGPK